jgi:hypothetical protein
MYTMGNFQAFPRKLGSKSSLLPMGLYWPPAPQAAFSVWPIPGTCYSGVFALWASSPMPCSPGHLWSTSFAILSVGNPGIHIFHHIITTVTFIHIFATMAIITIAAFDTILHLLFPLLPCWHHCPWYGIHCTFGICTPMSIPFQYCLASYEMVYYYAQ